MGVAAPILHNSDISIFMYACVDVQYAGERAKAVCLVFESPQSEIPLAEYQAYVDNVQAYVPGQFYKRELPCILAVLSGVKERIDVLLIDSYVWLDEKQLPGLGAYLYRALQKEIGIIGVAKNRFKGASHAREVCRGESSRPLFVTSIGIALDDAVNTIEQMHGAHRIPTLLKLVDSRCRGQTGGC